MWVKGQRTAKGHVAAVQPEQVRLQPSGAKTVVLILLGNARKDTLAVVEQNFVLRD